MPRKAEAKQDYVFVAAVWLAALCGVLGGVWLLVLQAVNPGGTRLVRTDFRGVRARVSELKPSERLAADGRTFADGPVYVDVDVPAGYERVTTKWRVRTDGPIAEIGALQRAGGQYLMRPALNRHLLDLGWPTVTDGGQTLHQRHATYTDLARFFDQPPSPARVAVSGSPRLPASHVLDYRPADERLELHLSLRGRHRLKVYLAGGERLALEFVTQDMNRAAGSDRGTVAVYDLAGERLYELPLPDDGDESDDQAASALATAATDWTAPASAYYIVDFAVSDDVFLRRLFTRQRHLGFLGRVHFGDQIGYWDQPNPVTARLSGWQLAAMAPTVLGRQTLTVGSDSLKIGEANRRYRLALADGAATVTVRERPLILYTDGELALGGGTVPASVLRPADDSLSPAELTLSDYEFVMAQETGARLVAPDTYELIAAFDVTAMARTEQGAYRFVLRTPGLAAWGDATLEAAEFVWERPPLAGVREWGEQFSAAARAAATVDAALPSPRGESHDEIVP
jgi:hypothetical protein